MLGLSPKGEGGVIMESVNEPRAKREKKVVILRNNNPQGNPMNAPRCGAKTRKGTRCQGPAMANGRCRMHGGGSTGPRTPEGLARSRKARWKHGFYSREVIAERRMIRKFMRGCREFLHEID